MERLFPKYVGRDWELSTSGIRADGRPADPWTVTKRILGQLPGVARHLGIRSVVHRRQGHRHCADCLRVWLSNGQCFYSDLAHVEMCTPETKVPSQVAAHSLAGLRLLEQARRQSEAASDPGDRFFLSTACCDHFSPAITWGPHFNVSISPSLWRCLFGTLMYPDILLFVATAIAASAAFFGTGWLSAEAGGPRRYLLSARGPHITRLVTHSTTIPYGRGLLNRRREPHCRSTERLHLISLDPCLVATPLLVAVLQSTLLAAEGGHCCAPLATDPVRALHTWMSHHPWSPYGRWGYAAMGGTRPRTLPQYMAELSEGLMELWGRGAFPEEFAPENVTLLQQVSQLAGAASQGDLMTLARHLDWAAKLVVLRHHTTSFDSPQALALDHDFANTDPNRGIFWNLWTRGLVEPLVNERQIERAMRSPPAESRAKLRSMLIHRFHRRITDTNWDCVELPAGQADGQRGRMRICLATVNLPCSPAFRAAVRRAADTMQLARLLERCRSEGHLPDGLLIQHASLRDEPAPGRHGYRPPGHATAPPPKPAPEDWKARQQQNRLLRDEASLDGGDWP